MLGRHLAAESFVELVERTEKAGVGGLFEKNFLLNHNHQSSQ